MNLVDVCCYNIKEVFLLLKKNQYQHVNSDQVLHFFIIVY